MADDARIYVGDTPPIILDCGEDVSGFAVLQIKWKKPSGATATKNATPYQTNYAKYDTVDGDLDEEGLMYFQTYGEENSDGSGWKGHGRVFRERIYAVEVS